jgi:hypothetical protein
MRDSKSFISGMSSSYLRGLAAALLVPRCWIPFLNSAAETTCEYNGREKSVLKTPCVLAPFRSAHFFFFPPGARFMSTTLPTPPGVLFAAYRYLAAYGSE